MLLSVCFRDVYVDYIERLVKVLLRVGLWPIQGCFRAYIGFVPEIKG